MERFISLPNRYIYILQLVNYQFFNCQPTPINFAVSDNYCIFFDSSKAVRQVEVFNYQATPGYEITAKGWLKQFAGFSGIDSLVVNKNIDGISGATISVYAITADV